MEQQYSIVGNTNCLYAYSLKYFGQACKFRFRKQEADLLYEIYNLCEDAMITCYARVSFRGGGGEHSPPLGNFVLTVNQFKCFKSLL